MTNTKRVTATEAMASAESYSKELIAKLSVLLFDTARKPIDWAMVGTINHINEQLREVVRCAGSLVRDDATSKRDTVVDAARAVVNFAEHAYGGDTYMEVTPDLIENLKKAIQQRGEKP